MTPRESYDGAAAGGNAAAALAPGWRLAIALCLALAGASLPLLLAAALLANDPPMTPRALLELFGIQVALPLAAAWAGWRAHAADVRCEGAALVIERRGRRLEAPLASIAGVEPWRLPLPAPGLRVRLRSGRTLPWSLAAADPAPLLATLAAAGVPGAAEAADGAIARWAHARGAWRRRPIDRIAKFGLFALAPAALLFHAHQHIAYGGLLGEWYLMGRGAWLRTLATYLATTAVALVLYAAAWRGVGEAIALFAARVAPPRAAGVRRAVERLCQVAYFGGVPLLLALRFLP